EGALYRRVRVSGRVCPLCGRWCEEVEHRYYRCPRCGIVVDRDYGASFTAALETLPPPLAEELRKWLRAHPKALARNYANPAGAKATAELNRLRGAPLPGTPSGRASPFGGRSWGTACATRGRAAGRRSGDGALKGASRPPFKRPPP
ncbi:MAG: zinc ribbon domain-containing protein, partial [Thermofilum sp.]